MSCTSYRLAITGALALLAAGKSANAQTFFPNNATINYAINGNAVIGYANAADYNARLNPTSPTVNLMTGGVNGNTLLWNNSILNVSGGSIGSSSSGSVTGELDALNASTTNISGGNVYGIALQNMSTLNISGGVIGPITAYDSDTINISGGSVVNIITLGNSQINVTHGNFSSGLSLSGNSVAKFSGTIRGILYAGATTYDNSTFSFYGGFADTLYAHNSSVINLSGGNYATGFVAYDSSTLNIFGTGLTTSFINTTPTGFSSYYLSGTLSDGTVYNNRKFSVQSGTGAKFTLNAAVPEPGSVALLVGMAGAGVSLLRRRRR